MFATKILPQYLNNITETHYLMCSLDAELLPIEASVTHFVENGLYDWCEQTYCMIVAVGSENPLKIKAVREVFNYFFNSVDVKSCTPTLSISKQPKSLRETLMGAIERALSARDKVESADYGVGIEAGLFKAVGTITGYLKTEICVIVDELNRMTLGMSPSFEFPLEAVLKVIRGEVEEVEEVMEKVFGVERIGEKVGTIYYLTRGLVSRKNLTEQAVIMALVPRLNENLYKKSYPMAKDVLSILKARGE